MTRTPAQEVLAHSLDLLEAGDARGWVDLFAVDGVLEFPYAPAGWPDRFAGRDALWQQMEKFAEHLEVAFSGLEFHPTADPELVIAEYRADGRALRTGLEFHQRYISVVRVRGGEILLYRDFWNPLSHLAALGGAEAALRIVA
ncbi:nuclear transport factor 2 family protein [Amycolatopsis sp. SID8362]|uniref:nuclear transport factor 2 family protein n=1 Tax=Amycolatopsis sp. SID8362 TaxID=2690346 RepID=UPI00136E619E|nr:nuclear transport factor 2 family protein [Amycolatopsis sp. SID8362]NBH02676.1 phenazine biosynthesis protein [Amycolatopsis sp. SID8362]NED39378.1 nuclear transport factor 2 family protein [Amycolatopsis sp. SID8362]